MNPRAKRVDARIVFVPFEPRAGESLVGLLAHEQTSAVVKDSWLVLELEPRALPQLPDTSLVVTVAALRADAPRDTSLADADAVVLVVPGKGHEGDLSDWLQASAERTPGRSPITVLVDQDSPDRTRADARVASLGSWDWPVLAASCAKGTELRPALDEIASSVLARITEVDAELPSSTSFPEVPRGEGNPLLNALRRVLETTIEKQVQQSTRELTRRLERTEQALGTAVEQLGTLATLVRASEERAVTAQKALDAIVAEQKRVASQEQRRSNLLEAASTLLEATSTTAEDTLRTTTSLARQVQQGDDAILHALRDSVLLRLDGLAVDLQSGIENTTEVDAKVARIETTFAELIEELKKPKRGWFG